MLQEFNIGWKKEFSQILEKITLKRIERQLEILGRKDIVDLISKDALITKGMKYMYGVTIRVKFEPISYLFILIFEQSSTSQLRDTIHELKKNWVDVAC